MSRLDELIEEYCPNGVEYKPFGEVATIVRGASPRPIKNFVTTGDDGVNWIKIGDVKPGSKYITETAEKITPDGAKKYRFVKEGDFILSNSMSFGRPYIMKTQGYIHDGWLAISNFDDYYISDFLYHLMNSNKYQRMMRQKASFGGAVQNLNADIVRELDMPIVPLEIQSEIVRILDNFTELTAELTARKKQYETYRNKLFDIECETVPITAIAHTYIGLVTTMTKHYVPQGVKLIHNSSIKENRFEFKENIFLDEDFAIQNNSRRHKIGDIITVHTGDVGTSAIIDEELDGSLGFATIVSRIYDTTTVMPKYVCYYLNSRRNKQNIVSMIKGDRNNLNLKDFNKLTVPIPPLSKNKSEL